MLTLENFEKELDTANIVKGRNYYNGGAVIRIAEAENNTWRLEIEGTKLYSVQIKLTPPNEILESNCNCPIGEGDHNMDGNIIVKMPEPDVCKHVVAALYAIREAKNKEVNR